MRLSIAWKFVRHARASGGAASKKFVRHACASGGGYSYKELMSTILAASNWNRIQRDFDIFERNECRIAKSNYYKSHLGMLQYCYERMGSPHPKDIIMISDQDFAGLALRFQAKLQSSFRDQIVENKIVVMDKDNSVYPKDWRNWITNVQITSLLHPIQVVKLTKPPVGRTKIYVGVLYRPFVEEAGGGVVIVDSAGSVELYCVGVKALSRFEAEMSVLSVATRHAQKISGKIDFVTDCSDVVEGMGGHCFIQPDKKLLFWELLKILSELDWSIQHIPKVGNALANEIAYRICARSVEKKISLVTCFQKVEKFGLEIPDKEMMMKKLSDECPILKIEMARGRERRVTPRKVYQKD